MDILNERPQGMTHQEYAELRREQNRVLKSRRQGTLVYCASEIVEKEPEGKVKVKSVVNHGAFVGVASKLGI